MEGNDKELWSLTYVNEGYLIGPCENGVGQLEWRSININNERDDWKSVPLKYSTNVTWNNLWGNLGSIRTFNARTNVMTILVSQGRSEQIHLGQIDVQTGTFLDQSVVPLNGDVGYSSEILLQMVEIVNIKHH